MMKKITAFIAMALASAALFAAKADSYVVESVTGKVQYEATPGSWKDVTVGQKISSATVVKTNLNSNLVVSAGEEKTTIKAMQNGAIDALVSAASGTAKTIKKGSLKNGAVAGKTETRKGVATASSRASEAKEDVEWDE
ncbi:hypothetical protein [Treponema sp.]|uniref:hypothetical protein n=1 Tax=Treponema sp. TaxID=166 RepID=UPI00388E063E